MILVYEPQCVGLEHADVNAAYLALIVSAFPGESIQFHGEKEQVAYIKNALPSEVASRTTFCEIKVPERKLGGFSRAIPDLLVCWNAFAFAKAHKIDRMIVLSTTTFGLLAFKIGMMLCRRPKMTAVVVHGVLETLALSRRKAFFFAFRFLNSTKLRLIVLGDHIKLNLAKIQPRVSGHISSMNIPYFFDTPPEHDFLKGGVAKLGMIGVASKAKGADVFFRLAKEAHDENLEHLSFHLSGTVQGNDQETWTNEFVTRPNAKNFVDGEEFREKIRSFDYIVFCYPKDAYRLTASGAFYEALSHGKPILCLSNDFFTNMFASLGDIGYIFESSDQLRDFLWKVNPETERSKYVVQRATILKSRSRLMENNEQEIRRIFGGFSSLAPNT